ncbi:MAG: hypothetical protein V9G25_09360 [Acidimicrobiia bacterium]
MLSKMIKLHQHSWKKIKEVTLACAAEVSDLGDGITSKESIASPGEISQADNKIGIADASYSEGNLVTTFYIAIASKGRYVVEVGMNDALSSATQANSILAKL